MHLQRTSKVYSGTLTPDLSLAARDAALARLANRDRKCPDRRRTRARLRLATAQRPVLLVGAVWSPRP